MVGVGGGYSSRGPLVSLYSLSVSGNLDLRLFGFQSVDFDVFDLMEFHSSNLRFISSRSCSAGSFIYENDAT